MRNKVWFASMVAVSSLILSVWFGFAGCTRGIKEGVYALTGSSGKFVLIQGSQEQMSLLSSQYGGVSVEPFQNDVGEVCSQEFLNLVPAAITEDLQYASRSITDKVKGVSKEEVGPFFTGPADKTLVIKGRVIQYDIGGVVDKAAGPLDEAICRMQFVDGQTGTLLAEGNCTGRVKSAVRTGPQELAKGVAKAIRKILKPKE
ncbi:MAG: hypothetical protein BWY71_00178 [Planctomycetes bacterium ADurb.Bin412]|nr:MAG: hypothetical protein BWY71_00178 [Planctomycetes bacterium ADurb.Bin412]